jgi:uncharacterized protein
LNRLDQVRQIVDQIVLQQPDEDEMRCGFVHLYGVSAACVMLAEKRGLDVEVCAVTGMLHDIWSYKTGDPTDHARLSAIEAESILRETGSFTDEEIALITDAISCHSAKDQIDGPLAELLKDADVFQGHLCNPSYPVRHVERLQSVLAELGLSTD